MQISLRKVQEDGKKNSDTLKLHTTDLWGIFFSGLSGIDAPITVYGAKMFAEFGFHIPYQYIMLMIPIGMFLNDMNIHCIMYIQCYICFKYR